MVNPFYVDPTGGVDVAEGIRGISEVVGQIGGKREKEKRLKAAEEKFTRIQQDAADAYRSNNPNKVAEFSLKNPEWAQAMDISLDHRDERTKQVKLAAYRQALADPANAKDHLEDGIAAISGMGGRPDNMMNNLGMMTRDSEGAQNVMAMEYATLDPKGWGQLQKQIGYIDPAKAQELDIKKQTLDVRRQESGLRKSEQQLAKETNELKREELKLKIDEKRQKLESKKREVEKAQVSAVDTLDKGIDTVDRLLTHPGLVSAVGASQLLPSIPGTDRASFEAELESFDAQAFLGAVEQMVGMGQLSDAEGRKLSASVGAINPRMKEEDFIYSLRRIKVGFEKAKTNVGVNHDEQPGQPSRLDELRSKARL